MRDAAWTATERPPPSSGAWNGPSGHAAQATGTDAGALPKPASRRNQQPELVMERALVAVEPDDRGWQVRIDDHPVVRNMDKFSAMQRAASIARDCHESMGLPTGVLVRMAGGEDILIGKCG
jgi:hypothetical protein